MEEKKKVRFVLKKQRIVEDSTEEYKKIRCEKCGALLFKINWNLVHFQGTFIKAKCRKCNLENHI